MKLVSALVASGSATTLSSVVANADTEIIVKNGQTLKSIASDHNIDVDTLAKANNLKADSPIHAKQSITIPDGDPDDYYIVEPGDTVSDIATDRGLSTDEVLKLNNLSWEHSTIFVGQKLKLVKHNEDGAQDKTNKSQNVQEQAQTRTTTQAPVQQPVQQAQGSLNIQGTDTASKSVNLALQLTRQGIPYVWGGESLRGMDCSGLVKYIYGQLGYQLPHNTVMQERYVTKINTPTPQQVRNVAHPGDLLFWGNQGASYHVAIYIGNGQYVQAPTYGQNVSVSNVNAFCPQFVGVLR